MSDNYMYSEEIAFNNVRLNYIKSVASTHIYPVYERTCAVGYEWDVHDEYDLCNRIF